jgi:hypothetical protein
MNDVDLERDLRALLEIKAQDANVPPHPPTPVLRRARRRQIGTGAAVTATTIAVLAASVFGIQRLASTDPPPDRPAEPVLPDTPEGFRSAVLPYASIAYPDGWYLLETSPLVSGYASAQELPAGPVLQLANFDPDIPHAPRCFVEPDNIPSDGVLLTVGIVPPQESEYLPSDGRWPVDLHAPRPETEPVCERGSSEEASWLTDAGVQYSAQAIYGPDAAETDVTKLRVAYSTLLTPTSTEPQVSRMGALQGLGTPRAVLGTTTFDSEVLTFVAYLELGRVLWVGVESSGSYGGATAPYSGSPPVPAVNASLAVVSDAGALLYGTIAPEVSRVEVRTDTGDTAPVSVVPLPESLGFADRFVWASVVGAGDRSTIVGYDASGEPIGAPNFQVGPSEVLGSGAVDGVPWTLTLTRDNAGFGVEFEFEGHGGGGGGFGDLGHRVFYGASSSGPGWSADSGMETLPLELYGLVSDDATRVEYRLVSGETIEASLFELPDDAFGGGAQVYLLFVPVETLVNAGDVVAYDASGSELGRQYLDFSPVSLFPKVIRESSAEAVEAMRDLQLAGAVAGRYFLTHDLSWEGFDPTDAASISDEVTYNDLATAVVGEVSIRVTGPERLVLATVASNGEVYSACMGGGSVSRYGRNDTSESSGCTNGWLDPPG